MISKKIIKLDWIDKTVMDLTRFDHPENNALWYYITKQSEDTWMLYSRKKMVEKAYGLYGIDDLEGVQKEHDFPYDVARPNRIIDLQPTLWYRILENIINTHKDLGLLHLWHNYIHDEKNSIRPDLFSTNNFTIKELLLYRHYYKDNVIVHNNESAINNENLIMLFFVKVDNNNLDKIIFIDSQENIPVTNNQVIMFPAHKANDFMVIKKNKEEEPIYYIQAILSVK